MTIRLYTENWELTLIVIVVAVLIAAMVAALCKVAARDSKQEEDNHPCGYCQRWGECNGVDEACPWLS